MTIKLIVGLANPGTEYSATRHNAGAWYVHLLAKYYCQSLKMNKFFGYTCQIMLDDISIHLLVAATFMNLSGKAVAKMADFYHISPKEILVAHDELNLLPGFARLKQGGGHNGHNGLKNIMSYLGDNSYYRLRIGIGHPGNKNKVVNFVLNKPTIIEQQLIDGAINESVCCTNILFSQDIKKAMNRLHAYNAK